MKRLATQRRYMRSVWILISCLLLVACTSGAPTFTPDVTVTVENDTLPAPTSVPATATPEPLAALVNDEALLLEDYERQIARYEASMTAAGQDPATEEGQTALAEGRIWVLEIMIDQLLVEQRARVEGLGVDDAELEMMIQSLREEVGEESFINWLEREAMSLEEMREILRGEMLATKMTNKIAEQAPLRAEHIHARHILLNSAEEAQQVLNKLQAGGDFADLARTYSLDESTRNNGGDLGYFPKAILISDQVEAAAFALQPGQISEIIPSSMGFHIVQVVQREAEMETSEENLRLLRDKAVREWLATLRTNATIQRFVTIAP